MRTRRPAKPNFYQTRILGLEASITQLMTSTTELHSALSALLATYEATGDHNHGRGPIAVGAPCPGGDCNVARARTAIRNARSRHSWLLE